jgi:hypothetical protein
VYTRYQVYVYMKKSLLVLMLFASPLQAQSVSDFCANPPCPCFVGDSCHTPEMPARDVICLPGFYIGHEANGLPICSDFPKEQLREHYGLSKKTILDFEKQIIDQADRAEKAEQRLKRCRATRGRRC